MTAPATTTGCLCGAIEIDVTAVRSELGEARARLREKDSPGNRASVAECWARIDALLDLLLAARAARR
jgi:hypothetical protein